MSTSQGSLPPAAGSSSTPNPASRHPSAGPRPTLNSLIPKPIRRIRKAEASNMPRNKDQDIEISLRFKYGIHTVFLLLSPLTTFDAITAELLEALRERYPDGLSSSVLARNDTPVPAGEDKEEFEVCYGVLANRLKRDSGWRELKVDGAVDTPASKGLRDAADIAFLFRKRGEDGKGPVFVVEWPKLDDDIEI